MGKAIAAAALLLSLSFTTQTSAYNTTTLWVGTYRCGQGVTGVTLTLRGAPGADTTALFEFYANPTSPTVPSGAFAMRGSIDAHGTNVSLFGDRWIDQPPDYIMVDIQGQFSSDGQTLAGRVIPQNGDRNLCTTVALVRAHP